MFKPEALAIMTAKRAGWDQIVSFARSPKLFLSHMDAAGIDRAVLINYVPPEVIGFPPAVNEWIANYVKADPARLIPCGSIHPRPTQNAMAAMEQIIPL